MVLNPFRRYPLLPLLNFVSALSPLTAQRPFAPQGDAPDAVRQAHAVQIAPHLVVFDPTHTSTTLTLSNQGSVPAEADIVIELGYTFWQNRDAALFPTHDAIDDPRDTVIATPTARDHSATAWLSGVPTHVRLQPHQRRTVTLRIAPPAHLPDGEYYARIVTIVRPKRRGSGAARDTRQMYQLPVTGTIVAPLRDSARVFYRQGPQRMGVQLSQGVAAFDTTPAGQALGGHVIRYKVHIHLTGTAHFEGYKSNYFLLATGDTVPLSDPDGQAFTIHHDGYMAVDVSTAGLNPGPQTFVFRLIPQQTEFPVTQRLPMQPVELKIPFILP